MAPPEPTRQRSEARSGRHQRTISSTTLLLVLSLVLAVLAVLLSLPSRNPGLAVDPSTGNLVSYLTPKRTRDLIARESSLAAREAEVARREAAVFNGAAAGIQFPTVTVTSIATVTATVTAAVLEETSASLTPSISSGSDNRVEDVVVREHHVSEREKDVANREEIVGRREVDASRRETWIMEHLVNSENDAHAEDEEEEILVGGKAFTRKTLPSPVPPQPITVFSTITALSVITSTSSVRVTVTVPEPAATRPAHIPSPISFNRATNVLGPDPTLKAKVPSPEEPVEDSLPVNEASTVTVTKSIRTIPDAPKGWFGGRF